MREREREREERERERERRSATMTLNTSASMAVAGRLRSLLRLRNVELCGLSPSVSLLPKTKAAAFRTEVPPLGRVLRNMKCFETKSAQYTFAVERINCLHSISTLSSVSLDDERRWMFPNISDSHHHHQYTGLRSYVQQSGREENEVDKKKLDAREGETKQVGDTGKESMVTKYGVTFLVWWGTLYCVPLAAIYAALSSGAIGGADAIQILKYVGLDKLGIDITLINPTFGNVALSYGINEALEVVR